MADKKISALTPSTTPLTGAEVLPIVQSGSTVKVSVANLTVGRDVAATSITTGLGAVGTPAYTFSGDTNTGIYSPAADTIAFVEGGVEAVRITSAGNVGIGTSSPTAKTHILTGDSPTTYTGPTSGTWAAKIGMTTNGTANNGLSVWNAWAGSGATIFEIATGFSGLAAGYFPTYSALGDATHIWKSISGTEHMRVTSAGDVGIGTSAPGQKLDVKGVVRSSIGTGTGAGGAGYAFYQFGTSATNTENWHIGSEGDGSFRFYNQGFGAGLERMRISSAGDVAIGTSSPNASAILDVQSTTKGFRLPNMTTTQKNAISSPAAGLMVFDTTLAKACVYSGSAWQTITSI